MEELHLQYKRTPLPTTTPPAEEEPVDGEEEPMDGEEYEEPMDGEEEEYEDPMEATYSRAFR